MTSIRVVIADDHPVFRRGLARMIESTDGMEVVGQAVDGQGACDVIRRFRPHVAIVDLKMPGMNGLEVTRTVSRDCPDVGVLVLTMSEDEGTVWAALRAGARGYLLKSADEDAIGADRPRHRAGRAGHRPWSSQARARILRPPGTVGHRRGLPPADPARA